MYAIAYSRTIPHFLIKLSDNVQILPKAEHFNTGSNIWQKYKHLEKAFWNWNTSNHRCCYR